MGTVCRVGLGGIMVIFSVYCNTLHFIDGEFYHGGPQCQDAGMALPFENVVKIPYTLV